MNWEKRQKEFQQKYCVVLQCNLTDVDAVNEAVMETLRGAGVHSVFQRGQRLLFLRGRKMYDHCSPILVAKEILADGADSGKDTAWLARIALSLGNGRRYAVRPGMER